MSHAFDLETIEQLAKRLREPSWLTELRRRALAAHEALPWPHPSDDVWRRTDVSLLDPFKGFAPAEPHVLQSIQLTDQQLTDLTKPLGDEQLMVRIDGAWATEGRSTAVIIKDLSAAAQETPDPIRSAMEADGLSPAEQKLTSLNLAFHHDDLFIQVPAQTSLAVPVRLIRLLTAATYQAFFPLTIIHVGAGSQVMLIDESVSLQTTGPAGPHLINGRTELVIEEGASVRYVRLQRWAPSAREFLLQRAHLARGAHLISVNVNLGTALSKAHVVTRLTGEEASARLYGFVFGHGAQHVDQHTLQDHQAPHTSSDLHFRAALQDASRMVYTGLIRIAPAAKETQAYQASHDLLLSREAKAETIPMLEILADDVQCKHGASVGPIDDEQTFYLQSRGVPRRIAERLIVMGFIEPIIQQVPFEPLQDRLRSEIEGELREEGARGTGHGAREIPRPPPPAPRP